MLQIGTILQDRFLIEAKIGSGGQGSVYLATDQKFGSRVAVKETVYDNEELAHAFEREARLLNSLHHPVLPHVSDIFSEGGGLLLVMEYIEGEDLSEPLKRGERLPIDSIVRWTFELLDALDYLHSQLPPIIHRDIKPNNLKITPRGNIVLLDFGLAKETAGNTLGMRSVFGYSRKYSPLEQMEGTGTDTRSDLFSLGATIFHLLTGAPPTDVLARASAVVGGAPDPLKLASELNQDVPVQFAALIKSAMSLNAKDRFETAAAMRTALEYSMSDAHPAADGLEEVHGAAAAVVLATHSIARDEAPNDFAAPTAGSKVPKPASRRWTRPSPAMARTAAAAAVSAAAAGRVRFRTYKSKSWRTAALVGAVLLLVAGVAFGVIKSLSPVPAAPETVAEAAPVLLESASAAGSVAPKDDVSQDQLATPDNEVVEPDSILAARPAADKTVKSEPVASVKRTESAPEPAPVARTAEPERARVVKPAPKRNRQPVYSDEPPVAAMMERIFNGGGERGELREEVISKEEWKRQRQIRKAKRRAQQFPPF